MTPTKPRHELMDQQGHGANNTSVGDDTDCPGPGTHVGLEYDEPRRFGYDNLQATCQAHGTADHGFDLLRG